MMVSVLSCLGLGVSCVAAAPISGMIVARDLGIWVPPPTNELPYLVRHLFLPQKLTLFLQGLLAIAICVPLIVILLLIYFYHRRNGHYPRFGRKRGNISAPLVTPAVNTRSRRRGVWRAQQPEEGLPGYTMEATGGEMSLGVGRKRSDEAADYDLAGTGTTIRASGEGRATREHSVATVHDGEEIPPTAAPANISESLPPYIPPPTPALVADGDGFGRVSSRQSQNSIGNRLSFPRAITTTSRRSSRIES